MVTKKDGFTVAEVLIVLVIVGVIVVFLLTLVKPNNTVLKLQYYKAYNALATAAYNVYENSVQDNKNMPDNNSLCEKLSEYINGEQKCSGARLISLSEKTFDSEKVQIISSNGMLFYFSASFERQIDEEKVQRHRVVWVDINGKRRPNTAKWSERRPADIVAFDITDTGEVVPLGYPKFDKRYLLSKVIYSSESKDVKVYSFYEAQKIAFGTHEYEYDVFSYNIEDLPNFNNSELKVNPAFKTNISQSEACVNAEDEKFPKCSVEIIK